MNEPLSITKTSYSVLDFLEWQQAGTLDLQPYYQRRAVWNPRIKSLLMDSIIRGFPIPLVFLHNRLDVSLSKTVRQVVDGQQRLRTILSFVDIDSISDRSDWDEFTILRAHNKELAGLKFDEMPDEVRQTILQTSLSVNVLPTDISDVTILQIFQRMNTTGLKLTPQEVRNGTYFGEFKDLSYTLAYEQNQRWTSWGLFRRQDIAQMAEVEFTSDLMGALIHGVVGKSAAQITNLYKEFEESFPQRHEIAGRFREAIEAIAPIYDERTGVPLPKRFRSTAWFYPIFAVVAGIADTDHESATQELPVSTPPDTIESIPARKLAEALVRIDQKIVTRGALSEELSESLRRQTTHKASRNQRIRLLRSEL